MTDYSVGTNIGKIATALNKLADAVKEPHVTHRLSKSQVALLVAGITCAGTSASKYEVTNEASHYLNWLNENSS